MEVNFDPFAVDNLLRGPRDRNPGPLRGHHNDIAIRTMLEKTNIAVMREDFWPQLQIRRCLEDLHLRRVHEKGIGLVHEQIETAQSFHVARLLPNTASFLENLGQKRGK